MSRRHAATSGCMAAIRSRIGMKYSVKAAAQRRGASGTTKPERAPPVNGRNNADDSQLRDSGPGGPSTGNLPTRAAGEAAGNHGFEGMMQRKLIALALAVALAPCA